MTDKEAPKYIYLHNHDDAFNRAISYAPINDTSIKYVRADTFHACMEAGCSLHHWLFEMVNLEPTPEVYADAQLALDKWDRFLDGAKEK